MNRRILVVKTSSLGDVVHTLPAVTDAARMLPGLRIDWAVEEGFAEIPRWHPAVDRVIPVAIRRWRKSPWRSLRSPEWRQCRAELAREHYDCVLDAQGLLKSAWLARYARGPRAGFDRQSVREPLAALAYHQRVSVFHGQHAVERVRQLFARSLGYRVPDGPGDYGLDPARFLSSDVRPQRVVFLHGTTRPAKHWPELYWQALCRRVAGAGFVVSLPWGNDAERARAERIASVAPGAEVLPRLNLHGIASVLLQSRAVVAVDTGLGHLSAALGVPALSLYGPTSPALVGTYGSHQLHLSASGLAPGPAEIQPTEMAPLTADVVWQALAPLLDQAQSRANSRATARRG